MKNRNLKSRNAFTLIELLTVVAIIGILAGLIAAVGPLVMRNAKITKSKAAYAQLATAISAYKAEYGVYPVFGGAYAAAADTAVNLNAQADVTNLIQALTGRTPIWDGATLLNGANAQIYNRLTKEFYDFSQLFQKDDAGAYTMLLTDAFDNTHLRLVMDTDNNGLVHPADLPASSADYGTDANGNIPARVIIYTLRTDDPAQYQDVLSWQ